MKHPRVPMLLLWMLVLVLAGCSSSSGLNLGGTAAVATQVLDPAAVAALEAKCQQATPMLAAATAPNAPPSVSQTAVYGSAYCQQLLASGVPPATTTSTTPSWLPSVISAVQTAAQIAAFVLPLI